MAVGRAPFLSLSFRIYPALGQRMMRGRRDSMRVLDALVRHVLAGTRAGPGELPKLYGAHVVTLETR